MMDDGRKLRYFRRSMSRRRTIVLRPHHGIFRPVAEVLVEEHHGEAALYGVDAATALALDGVAQQLDVAQAEGASEDAFQADFAGGRALLSSRLRN